MKKSVFSVLEINSRYLQSLGLKLEVIPSKSSSIVGEIWELYVVLNHRMTFCMNDFVKEQ